MGRLIVRFRFHLFGFQQHRRLLSWRLHVQCGDARHTTTNPPDLDNDAFFLREVLPHLRQGLRCLQWHVQQGILRAVVLFPAGPEHTVDTRVALIQGRWFSASCQAGARRPHPGFSYEQGVRSSVQCGV